MSQQGLVRLTREIRFHLPLDRSSDSSTPVLNSWSGWPTSHGLAPFFSLQCTLEGPIDPRTDYVCNVKDVDCLLRQFAIAPICDEVSQSKKSPSPEELLVQIWRHSKPHIPIGTTLHELRLHVSPYLSFAIHPSSYPMVCTSQQFEFSASHRLHNLELSAAENQRLYGKCNNPHGHGHNYVLEVSLELADDPSKQYSTTNTEQIVKSKIIDRLDHRHLNIEVPPFDRLNPTVENIAVTIWGWLANEFEKPHRLVRVRVYETPKTWADYSGPPNAID